MSCICTRGEALELSGRECVDSEQYVQSSEMNTVSKSSKQGCETEQSNHSLSGTKQTPSTPSRGEESSLGVWLASLASHSQPPPTMDIDWEMPTPEISGLPSVEFYGVLDRNLSDGYFWKMSRASFCSIAISAKSSPTWRPSGLMLSGKLGQLHRWGRIINDIAYGSTAGDPDKYNWHTPTTHLANERAYPAEFERKTPTLTAEVAMGEPYIYWDKKSSGRLRKLQVIKEWRNSSGLYINPAWLTWTMGWIGGMDSTDPIPPENVRDFQEKMRDGTWWDEEPEGIPRAITGVERRKKKLAMIGNGMVPLCFFAAFNDLTTLKAHFTS